MEQKNEQPVGDLAQSGRVVGSREHCLTMSAKPIGRVFKSPSPHQHFYVFSEWFYILLKD